MGRAAVTFVVLWISLFFAFHSIIRVEGWKEVFKNLGIGLVITTLVFVICFVLVKLF